MITRVEGVWSMLDRTQLLMCPSPVVNGGLENISTQELLRTKYKTRMLYFVWSVLPTVMIPNHLSDTHAALSSGEGEALVAQMA